MGDAEVMGRNGVVAPAAHDVRDAGDIVAKNHLHWLILVDISATAINAQGV